MDKLYMTAEEAAEYVGVGVKFMHDLLNGRNPPPYLKVGNKRLLQVAALPDYFESLQEVKR